MMDAVKHLKNAGKLLADCAARRPIRQPHLRRGKLHSEAAEFVLLARWPAARGTKSCSRRLTGDVAWEAEGKSKDHLGDLVCFGRIILKWIFVS
jgi:hypothetical protein